MGTFRAKLCSIIYYFIGWALPDSYRYVNIFGKSIHLKYGLIIRRKLGENIIQNCGRNVNIEKYARFNRDISLGDNSGIGFKCSIPPGTVIGDNVMMGPEVILYNQNHEFSRTDIPICEQGFRKIQPVVIGNDVWIGRRVIILPGVTIGDGCVIGAGAVVAKDIPPYSVAVGNPAYVVKNRKDIEG